MAVGALTGALVFAAAGCGDCQQVEQVGAGATGSYAYTDAEGSSVSGDLAAVQLVVQQTQLVLRGSFEIDGAPSNFEVTIQSLRPRSEPFDLADRAELCVREGATTVPRCSPLSGTIQVTELDEDCGAGCPKTVRGALHAESSAADATFRIEATLDRHDRWVPGACEGDPGPRDLSP